MHNWVVYVRVQKTGSALFESELLTRLVARAYGNVTPNGCGYGQCGCQSRQTFYAEEFKANLRGDRRPCANALCTERLGLCTRWAARRPKGVTILGYGGMHLAVQDAERLLVRHVPAARALWVTWLREPLARTLSEFYHTHWRSRINHVRATVGWDWVFSEGACGNYTLRHWLLCSGAAPGAANRMVRMLSGRSFVVKPLEPTETSGALARAGLPHGLAQRPLGEDDLASARTNLRQRFAWFGLLECAPASLWALHRLLGVPWRGAESASELGAMPVRSNASATRHIDLATLQRTDPRAVELLREQNSLDVDLYSFATGLLGERLERDGWAGGACV